ncbi:MAG: ECF transporter S component [Lachnospiraceae bacterium]|nr:ECF transporter S component [Lachnospiraceae bacterium]MDY5742577.1 ECF transporter S component [Lachnospiraceae bacterium]
MKETIVKPTAQKPEKPQSAGSRILLLAQTALMAALCYVIFQFFRIDIPLGAGKTSIHFANGFVVLAALILGGLPGGLAGGIGLAIADLTSNYATAALPTFFLKLGIGLIAGLVAHRIGHIRRRDKEAHLLGWVTASAVCAMIFNVICDPLVRYLSNRFLFGLKPDFAATLAKFTALSTLLNAIVAVAVSTLLYMALRPLLQKLQIQ